jgi:hypothetical protein
MSAGESNRRNEGKQADCAFEEVVGCRLADGGGRGEGWRLIRR